MHFPRRIISLQPSITSTLERLGALERVVACTKYCADVCPGLDTAKIAIVQDSWSSNASELKALQADLVIASVPYRLESFTQILKAGIPVLALAPQSFAGVLNDIRLLAAVVHLPEAGEALAAEMTAAMASLAASADAARGDSPPPRVHCEEWGKPVIRSQMWVKEIINAAGGEFLGVPGSTATEEEVAALNPDVVLAAWCGAGDRVPLEKLCQRPAWQQTEAVVAGSVYCLRDELLNTPGPSLMDGMLAIRHALWPAHFPAPPGVRRIGQP